MAGGKGGAGSGADPGNLHIVMFPWLGFGHMMPFLELSKALARRGHKVSFLSTPRNIERLPKIPPSLSPLVEMVELRLPYVEGLPDGIEASGDLRPDQQGYLKKAFDGLKEKVARFLETTSPKPDWVFGDFASHWLPDTATNSGIPFLFFSPFHASAHGFIGSPSELIVSRGEISRTEPEDFTTPPKWITFPTNVAYRLHEAKDFVYFYKQNSAAPADMSGSSRLGLTIEKCKAMAIRSCEEFDTEWFPLLRDVIVPDKPVIPTGLLIPSVEERDGKHKSMEWLDNQRPGSVVFVGFGSEARINSVEHLHEFALGLELSRHPFLWTIKKPHDFPATADAMSVLLPEGFEQRTRGRGFVCMDWVPQLNILAHESTGAYFTHSGWSSVIEALMFGKPLISFPAFGDQVTNSRVMVEKKVAVEVTRDESDGSFTREAVAEAVRTVMAGEAVRATAREMAKVFADRGLHDRYMDGFVEYLQTGSGVHG